MSALALFFLKLGTIAFGGPAAHIAMMEEELVARRRWISRPDFLDLLAVSNLIPGPSSTELAIYIGYRLGGLPGLLLAGVCFIAPAFAMVLAIAWGYVHYYGHLPAATRLLYGIKAVVIAIVLQALWRLGKSAIKTQWLAVLAVIALAVSLAGLSPVGVLASAAVIGLMVHWIRDRHLPIGSLPMAAWFPVPIAAASGARAIGGAGSIFLVFLKLGCVVFGSGYVLLAFLQSDLVIHRHWLSDRQLLDAVAVGQVTPGPVFTTATFIGYLIGGAKGAAAATIGIFTPAFVLVAATGPLIHRVRRWRAGAAILDALNAASLGLMAAVTWSLGRAAITDLLTATLAAVSLVLLFRFRVNSAWLIVSGAIAGVVALLVGK